MRVVSGSFVVNILNASLAMPASRLEEGSGW